MAESGRSCNRRSCISCAVSCDLDYRNLASLPESDKPTSRPLSGPRPRSGPGRSRAPAAERLKEHLGVPSIRRSPRVRPLIESRPEKIRPATSVAVRNPARTVSPQLIFHAGARPVGRRDRTSAVNETRHSVARAGWAGDLTPALLRKANSQNRRAAISKRKGRIPGGQARSHLTSWFLSSDAAGQMAVI